MDGVRHHMLSVYEDSEHINIRVFSDSAMNAIQGIRDRGSVPVVVGGTNYYIESLLFEQENLFFESGTY